jgi:hypothetical protein
LHDFETRSQVQTDSNNAALSSYDDLRHNNDGSVDLYFGPTAPEGYENNWVKTAETFFDKSWQLTDFERL